MKQNRIFDQNRSQKARSWHYNMDTNRAEAQFADGSAIAIDCLAIEDEYGNTPAQRAELDWLLSKGRSGEHLTTIPPYGYKKDPENKKRWIVDEEAAAVVQKIFALCMDGMGPTQIAKWLQENKVLSPVA